MIRFFTLFSLFFSSASFALESKGGPPELAVSSMLVSLLLVLGCIFAVAFLMKKTNLLKNARGKSHIRVVATQPLTTKSRVQLIDINGQQYLLGVTEHNITLLDKLEKPLTVDDEPVEKRQVTPFSVLLDKISKKSND